MHDSNFLPYRTLICPSDVAGHVADIRRRMPMYVVRTNKMHAFFINDLIFNLCVVFLSCIRMNSLVDVRMYLYQTHPDIDQTTYTDA